MIVPTWRVWALALVAALAVHAALAVGFYLPKPGVPEKTAGPPVSVSGSLAGILGSTPSEPVETTEVAEKVEPVKASEVPTPVEPYVKPLPLAPSKPADEMQPVRAAQETANRTRDQAPVEPLAARSVSEAPVAAVVPPERAEVTSPSPQANEAVEAKPEEVVAQPVAPARVVEESKPTERQAEPPKRREKEKQRCERAKKAERERRARAKQRRKAAAKSRAGSTRQGAAGIARGGQSGRSRASQGAVRNYGARVRSRILANRPSASGAGRAVISFGVSRGGALRYARVSRSSGKASLDRAALSAVRRSSPFPRPPSGATARQLIFSISFTFR